MARPLTRRLAAAGFATVLAVAGSTLTPSASLADAHENACPELTQAKYPFIQCTANEHGGVTLSIPEQPAPLECHMRLNTGGCAASPEPWWHVFP